EDAIEIVPFKDTAYLIATWPGSDPSLGPIVVSAHMDVVEAKPEDWERDPFTPVVENGYLFGRGASDTKFEAALALSSMIELRRQGFTPTRSLVIAYSGDEETTMKTSKIIAERLRNARLVLNVDGSSGTLSEETGKPLFWSWQGAEKTYVDFQLEVTNPGGHSSAPRPENAIQQMSQALERIGAYRFKPEQNDITREYFAKAAKLEPDPKLSAAMQAFAANPADEEAIEVLRENPATVGMIGTTCVPTMVKGGHAINALPQRVTANINCRIFPGHTRKEIMAELERAAGVPEVTFRDATGDESIEAPPSPLDPLLLAAVTKAVGVSWGKEVAIFPSQSSGASDSMWYRAVGVPSYGASASMSKHSDQFSHGLNERIALSNISPGVTYYLSVFRDLSSQ
ncbi:MAG TPA: M20/M25/M40 family metallo-hydrolase, partial [Xanthomonadales bacterium]|nr:M20/M25/M40 family metallo-hydrolase [Xanthomonadales bacterium]